ncbi:MAG: hypothetical protein QME90_01295 [Thermodesulfobacteriota bacterium]|nr:hypothetical protein [Thermodesulfobacteriota bacterium]
MKKKLNFLIPSIGEIFFITLFLTLLLSNKSVLLDDADTGWHIRIGEFILDNFSIPRFDIFSYVTPPLPWITIEWLPELFMALIHRALGLTGVAIFFAFLISLLYYLLFRIIRLYKGNIIFDVLIILIVVISSMFHWLARPFILSLLLFLVSYNILEKFQSNGKNYLYFLPLIMLLWTNLHGGFITGFILIGTYLFCNIIILLISKNGKKEEYKKKIKILGLTTLLCLMATLINPFGYNVFLYTFKVLSNKYLMSNIVEFLPLNFQNPSMGPFKYLFLIVMTMMALTGKQLRFHELLSILLFTTMSIYSMRNVFFFAIVVAPILSRHSNLIFNQLEGRFVNFLKKRDENITKIDTSAKTYIWVFPFIFMAAIVLSYRLEIGFDEKEKPVAAVEFLKKEFIKGNMFNNDEFGDYIIYSAYPKYKVFIHGKMDWHAEEKLREYSKVTKFEQGWEDIIRKYDINWIIFETDHVFSRFLREREDWKLIYTDKVASIFVRNVPDNFEIIQKYQKPHSPD